MKQPFAAAPSKYAESFPILLFRAVDDNDSMPCTLSTSEEDSPLRSPRDQVNPVAEYPAELYVTCDFPSSDTLASEDACKLVLPFRIGARGYARTSDGSRFGEDVHERGDDVYAKDTFADVSQPGYTPFSIRYDARLVSVLTRWLEMIVDGH